VPIGFHIIIHQQARECKSCFFHFGRIPFCCLMPTLARQVREILDGRLTPGARGGSQVRPRWPNPNARCRKQRAYLVRLPGAELSPPDGARCKPTSYSRKARNKQQRRQPSDDGHPRGVLPKRHISAILILACGAFGKGTRQFLARERTGVWCEVLACWPMMAGRGAVIGLNRHDNRLSWGLAGKQYRPSGYGALDQARRQG
jgi:hypothetical protein